MGITAITIENFKCIRDQVKVDLKPITLLFGPNSSGKSTVIQAFHYARELFERENVDADRTIVGGKNMDLGGFKSFICDHNLDRVVSFRFDLDLRDIDLSDYLLSIGEESEETISDWKNKIYKILGQIVSGWIKVSVKWNKLLNRPVISLYEIGLNNCIFGSITADENNRQFDLTLYRHKIFPYEAMILDHPETFEPFLPESLPEKDLHITIEGTDFIASEEEDMQEDWGYDFDDKEPDYFSDDYEIPEVDEEHEFSKDQFFDNLPLKVSLVINQNSVLPEWDKNVEILEPFWDSDNVQGNEFYNSLISTLVKGPGIIIRDLLRQLCYLGPLRAVPSRSYSPSYTPDESRWSSGLAAWDVLHFADPSLINEINSWLANNKRLNSGYRVVLKYYKEMDINHPFMIAISQRQLIDEESSYKFIEEIPIKARLNLREETSNLEVLPQDIGIGISQVLPIVVAAIWSKRGIVAIEQPELHIHPAFQVALGDLFISQFQKKDLAFLIETHSEHLLLRILRRIRETHDNELPPDFNGLTPEKISIYYFENTEKGVCISELRVSDEGDSFGKWPDGFFEERHEELF